MLGNIIRNRPTLTAGMTLLLAAAAGAIAGTAAESGTSTARAAGHSPYSYKKGTNCTPGWNSDGVTARNVVDPVSVQLITKRSVGDTERRISQVSEDRHAEGKSKWWGSDSVLDDNKSQQGAYINGSGDRVCSSFTNGNVTSGAARTRYHLRLHTGGPSSKHRGYNIVAGTPHYDILCGRPFRWKHEIKTFAGARSEFLKVWPRSRHRQYGDYIGNQALRYMKCQKKYVGSDGWVAYIFID